MAARHRAGTVWAIVNPAAANGRAGERWPALGGRLRQAGVDLTACVTCGPGDGIRCARMAVAHGAGLLVVVGGDGTLNEVVNGCLDATSAPGQPPPRVALWPVGTGADFARGFGIGGDEEALAAVLRGVPHPVDIGRATFRDEAGNLAERAFVNVADLGLGPETSRRIARGASWFGPGAYFSGALASIAAYRPTRVRLTVDGEVAYQGDAGLVAVANGRYFGGGMRIAPHARLDDGLFDVFLLEHTSRRVLATELLPLVYRGAHPRHPAVHFYRGGAVTIEAGAPFPLELDGEVIGATPVAVTLLPQALQVMAPPSGRMV
jgi:YegS/Rv2252/BmrU family lipid kinase